MKILFVNAYFYPENIAFSHLEKDIIEGLQNAGHEIFVICPTPTRGVSDEVHNEYKRCKREDLNGIKIHRFAAPKEGKNPIIRAFRYFWCNLREYQIGKRYRNIDAVFAVSTPPTQGWIAGKLAKKLNVPFIYSLQDVFPDSLVTTGLVGKDSLIYKIGAKIERKTYRLCSKIIVISESFKQNILRKGVPAEKIVVVPNWIDESTVYRVPRSENKLFDEYRLDRTKFYISYSGNIGLTQNMDFLVRAAENLREDDDIRFVIVGEGVYKEELLRQIAEKKLTNITVIPFQPYERIAEVFSIGDVGLIISKTGVGNNSVPSKTWSYMSASTPILASFDMDSELCSLVSTVGCGICSKPDDLDSFLNSIHYMHASYADEIGNKGRSYIEQNLSKTTCTKLYTQVIESA